MSLEDVPAEFEQAAKDNHTKFWKRLKTNDPARWR